jgi:hypothetical protein
MSLVLVAVPFAAAYGCGGGGNGTPEIAEYLEQYERIDNQAERAIAELDREYEADTTADPLTDQNRLRLQEYYQRLIEARRAYVDGIKALEVPGSVQDEHDASVTTYEAVLQEFEAIIDDLGTAQNQDDLRTIFEGESLNAAIQRTVEACNALQAIADDREIDVNLECE